jgi:hypothetical protein
VWNDSRYSSASPFTKRVASFDLALFTASAKCSLAKFSTSIG